MLREKSVNNNAPRLRRSLPHATERVSRTLRRRPEGHPSGRASLAEVLRGYPTVNALLAVSTKRPKAASSRMARSASTLRSISTPALCRPSMKRL